MFAGETSASNPSAMSQSCNRLSLSILMIYSLASTTMLPGLKMVNKRLYLLIEWALDGFYKVTIALTSFPNIEIVKFRFISVLKKVVLIVRFVTSFFFWILNSWLTSYQVYLYFKRQKKSGW